MQEPKRCFTPGRNLNSWSGENGFLADLQSGRLSLVVLSVFGLVLRMGLSLPAFAVLRRYARSDLPWRRLQPPG